MLRAMFTNLALIWFCVQVWLVWYVARKEYTLIPEIGVPDSSFWICVAASCVDALWLFIEGLAVAAGYHGLLIPIANAVLGAFPKWLYASLPGIGIITGIATRWLSRKDVWPKCNVPKYAWVALVLTSHVALTLTLTQIVPVISKIIVDNIG